MAEAVARRGPAVGKRLAVRGGADPPTISPSKGEHLRTPGSTNLLPLAALMAPPPPPKGRGAKRLRAGGGGGGDLSPQKEGGRSGKGAETSEPLYKESH